MNLSSALNDGPAPLDRGSGARGLRRRGESDAAPGRAPVAGVELRVRLCHAGRARSPRDRHAALDASWTSGKTPAATPPSSAAPNAEPSSDAVSSSGSPRTEATIRATAGCGRRRPRRAPAGLDAERAQQLERVAQAEGDALEHRPDQRPAVVAQLEPDERARASGSACGVRSPARYGSEEEPLDARLPGLGLAHQRARTATSGASASWNHCERARRPRASRPSPARRPGPRGRTRGRGPRRRGRSGQRGEDDARRAEHDRERPGPVDADAERGRRLVAGAGRDGVPAASSPTPARSGDSRTGGSHAAGARAPRAPRRSSPPRDVEEERSGRVGDVGRPLPVSRSRT